MSDDGPNLVLEHLRAIRAEVHEVREEQREQRLRLGGIERSMAGIQIELAGLHSEIADMGRRLDRCTIGSTVSNSGSVWSRHSRLH
jgi:hypothetical protein